MQIVGIKTHFNLKTDYILILQNPKAYWPLHGRFEDERNETSTYMIWSTETQSIFVNIVNHNHMLEHYRCSLSTLI